MCSLIQNLFSFADWQRAGHDVGSTLHVGVPTDDAIVQKAKALNVDANLIPHPLGIKIKNTFPIRGKKFIFINPYRYVIL